MMQRHVLLKRPFTVHSYCNSFPRSVMRICLAPYDDHPVRYDVAAIPTVSVVWPSLAKLSRCLLKQARTCCDRDPLRKWKCLHFLPSVRTSIRFMLNIQFNMLTKTATTFDVTPSATCWIAVSASTGGQRGRRNVAAKVATFAHGVRSQYSHCRTYTQK